MKALIIEVKDPFLTEAFLKKLACLEFSGQNNGSSIFMIREDKKFETGAQYHQTDYVLEKQWDEACAAIEDLIVRRERQFAERMDKLLRDSVNYGEPVTWKIGTLANIKALINEYYTWRS